MSRKRLSKKAVQSPWRNTLKFSWAYFFKASNQSDQRQTSTAVKDANVYDWVCNPSAAIANYQNCEWITHFLEEAICTLAHDIFNLQDGVVAFACHRTTGPLLYTLWLQITLLFAATSPFHWCVCMCSCVNVPLNDRVKMSEGLPFP